MVTQHKTGMYLRDPVFLYWINETKISILLDPSMSIRHPESKKLTSFRRSTREEAWEDIFLHSTIFVLIVARTVKCIIDELNFS